MDTVGDLARTLVLRSHQTRLNGELDTLAVEIATGFVSDTASHLDGDITSLVDIDRSLAKLEAYTLSTTEARLLTSTVQTTLGEIQERSESLAADLLTVELTQTEAMFSTLSRSAEDALDQVLNALNRSVGGKFLFSGITTDTPPIIDSETMLSELRLVLAGETTVAGVEAALDSWFDTPGGGFETLAYQGSDSPLAPMKLSETQKVSVDLRADNQVFRELLKGFSKATLASDTSLGFSPGVTTELISNAALDLQGAQAQVVEVRAHIGATEQRIEDTATRNSAERTATIIARTELVGTDEFETATRFENTRVQLETLYAITARSSRLSLAEYL